MTDEARGIYHGLTIGEAEYRGGYADGRDAGEYDAQHFPATVWNTQEEARGEASSLSYRTRCYWLGWLRGYRSIVR